MRNDTQLKVTCTIDENKVEELHFDYFDKEGNFIGKIIVSSTGSLKWNIINALYQETINIPIEYILGDKCGNRFEYEMPNEDLNRWERALDMIEERNLYINYTQTFGFDDEKSNITIK